MKGQEVQVPQAPIAQDPKVSVDCLSWCFSGAGTTAQKVELCTEQDQCTGCDFCSESEVEKEVGKSGGGGASKATADKSEQGGSKPAVDKSKKEGGQEASACTSCGESNNCCTAGGSWFGQCPDQHSFEDGHKACVEGKLPGYVPRVQSDANDTGQGAPDQAEGAARPKIPSNHLPSTAHTVRHSSCPSGRRGRRSASSSSMLSQVIL